jgi:hypothetical protein
MFLELLLDSAHFKPLLLSMIGLTLELTGLMALTMVTLEQWACFTLLLYQNWASLND